jgi:UDP-N-acetylmuramoyl-tripeptide--D-alanyl-D-alanine ligase
MPKTIGITGSCGKTTTKRFLETILSEQGPVFATFGNFNSQIGIPLALCSLHEMQKTAIIEMGMSHAGDIKKLVDWIYLDFAIITSIGLSHAENFVDKDHGIAKAKAEILTHNPLGFFNEKTNLYQPFQTIACKQILKTTEISVSDQGVSFKIFDEVKGPFKTNIQASHLLENLHLALACSYKLGLCNEKIQAALLKLDVEPQRMQELKKQNIDFIDDSYNASPSSMREAVYYLKSKKAKRKIAVIGAMKELGLLSLKEHDHLGDLLIQDVDFVYLLGDETAIISEKIPQRSKHFSKLDDLKTDLESFLQEGDLVLVKGSHSTHLHTLVNSINLR